MPAEGAVSRGGEAIVLVWLEVVPCGEVLAMPVADDGRVPMSAAVKEPSTAVSKMSFAAVVAARISVVEITGWVTVETEVITGWVTSVGVATTGCTAATTGWVTSVGVATTGCTAATTGWLALTAPATTGCTAALTTWVLLVTAAVTGAVACAVACVVAAAAPVLLDDELVGDGLMCDGACASAEDGGVETTGVGEGEVEATVGVVVAGGVAAAFGVVAAAAALGSTVVASELAVFETVATAPVRLDVVGVLTPSADARPVPRNMMAMTTSAPNASSRRRERRRNTKDALLSSGIGGFIRYQRRRGMVAAELRDNFDA
jgi:hypothetical protein